MKCPIKFYKKAKIRKNLLFDKVIEIGHFQITVLLNLLRFVASVFEWKLFKDSKRWRMKEQG